MTTLGPTAARGKPRTRSKVLAICPCCNCPPRSLYPIATIFGTRFVCTACCRDAYNVRPGYTTDGRPMPFPKQVNLKG